MTSQNLLEGILSKLDAQWRQLVSEATATNALPCARAASTDWWLDPDTDEASGPNLSTRENQLRAQLLCYDCPIISECRRRGALETYNVWGGLTAYQRRRLAKGLATGRKRATPVTTGGLGREQVQNFKAGWTCEDLGLQLGQPAGAVMRALVGLLGRTQASWEERNADVHRDVSGMVRQARMAG